jgi:hypothetical protein
MVYSYGILLLCKGIVRIKKFSVLLKKLCFCVSTMDILGKFLVATQ